MWHSGSPENGDVVDWISFREQLDQSLLVHRQMLKSPGVIVLLTPVEHLHLVLKRYNGLCAYLSLLVVDLRVELCDAK